MPAYTVAVFPIWKRLLVGLGLAFLYVLMMIWIPVLGWIALAFTPFVLLVPLFLMKVEKRGTCPHCDQSLVHRVPSRSFKCPACGRRVIVTGAEFRTP